MINAGELKQRLNIFDLDANGTDENGFPVTVYNKLVSLRCKKKTQTAKDYFAADKHSSEVQLSFIVRNIRKHEINNTMFIQFENKSFNILHVSEIQNGEFLEFVAKEAGGVDFGTGI